MPQCTQAVHRRKAQNAASTIEHTARQQDMPHGPHTARQCNFAGGHTIVAAQADPSSPFGMEYIECGRRTVSVTRCCMLSMLCCMLSMRCCMLHVVYAMLHVAYVVLRCCMLPMHCCMSAGWHPPVQSRVCKALAATGMDTAGYSGRAYREYRRRGVHPRGYPLGS